MIIPVKCFTCGKVLANKYRYYLREVRKLKMESNDTSEPIHIDDIVYLTNENKSKTHEGIIMDNLKLTRICCRRHMLTHVDIE